MSEFQISPASPDRSEDNEQIRENGFHSESEVLPSGEGSHPHGMPDDESFSPCFVVDPPFVPTRVNVSRARSSFLGRWIDVILEPQHGSPSEWAFEIDPVRDILCLSYLRTLYLDHWKSQWKERHGTFPSQEELSEFQAVLHSLTSPQKFFYSYSGTNLYRPVEIFRAEDPSQCWPELSELIRTLTDRQDHSGILLAAASGSGKTVASWKAFFDCLYGSIRKDNSGEKPLLGDYVPCWIPTLSATPALIRLREKYNSEGIHLALASVQDSLITELLAVSTGLIQVTLEEGKPFVSPEEITQTIALTERYLEYGPRYLLFFDLNQVDELERLFIAKGLQLFHARYGKRHRCVVIYRSNHGNDPTLRELLNSNQFRQYDLRPLGEVSAQEYLIAFREQEWELFQKLRGSFNITLPSSLSGTELSGESVNEEADWRESQLFQKRMQQESRLLRELIQRTIHPLSPMDSRRESQSLICLPLLMHWVSLLRGTSLQRVRTITDLYEEVVRQHLERELSSPVQHVIPPGFDEELLLVALTRIALAILLRKEGTTIPVNLVNSLLKDPEGLCYGWFPEGSLFHNSEYCIRSFSREEIHAVLGIGLLRRQGESLMFLHDSLIDYFAGAVALRQHLSPGVPHPTARLAPRWAHDTTRVLGADPECWMLAGEFLGGALAFPSDNSDGLPANPSQVNAPARELLALLLLENPHPALPGLILRLLRNLGSDPLLAQARYALLEEGALSCEHPGSLLQQVYNAFRWHGPGDSAQVRFAERLLRDYREQPAEKQRPWLRILTPHGRSKLATQSEHRHSINCVASLSDGRIVSGCNGGRVLLWNPHEGTVDTIINHALPVWAIRVWKDRVISAGRDGLVQMWDPQTHQAQTLIQHNHVVSCLCVLDRGRIVSGSWDGTVKLWDPEFPLDANGFRTRTIIRHEEPLSCVMDAGHGRVASGAWDGRVKLWDPEFPLDTTNCHTRTIIMHDDYVSCICLIDGERIASGGRAGTVKLWDPASPPDQNGHQFRTIMKHGSWVRWIWAVEGGRVASCSWDAAVQLWDPALPCDRYGCQSRSLLEIESRIQALVPLDQGRVVIGTKDGEVLLYDPTQNRSKPSQKIIQHADPVSCLCVLETGQIVSGSDDKTLQLWDPRLLLESEGHLDRIMIGHGFSVTCVCAMDGGRVASGGKDLCVRMFDPQLDQTGKRSRVLYRHKDQVRALSALPGGRLASASWDRTVKLWESVTPGEELTRTILHHEAWIEHLMCLDQTAGAKDSNQSLQKEPFWVAAITQQGQARIWNSQTENVETQLIQNENQQYRTMKFLKDGRGVSLSTSKRSLILSGDKTGDPLEFPKHRREITAFTTIGSEWIISSDASNRTILWNTQGEALATLPGPAAALDAFQNPPVIVIGSGNVVYLVAIEPGPEHFPDESSWQPAN